MQLLLMMNFPLNTLKFIFYSQNQILDFNHYFPIHYLPPPPTPDLHHHYFIIITL